MTAVGAFDNGGDGFGANIIPVALYQLSGTTWNQVSGTYESFTGNAGTLVGSARMQTLGSPVALSPGTYSIVAANYGVGSGNERDWNANEAPGSYSATFNNGGGLIAMGGWYTAFFENPVTTLGGTLAGI